MQEKLNVNFEKISIYYKIKFKTFVELHSHYCLNTFILFRKNVRSNNFNTQLAITNELYFDFVRVSKICK